MRKWNLSLGCLLIATSVFAAPAKPQPKAPPQNARQAPPPPPQNRQQRPAPNNGQPPQQGQNQQNPNAQKKSVGKAEFRDGKWHVTNDWGN